MSKVIQRVMIAETVDGEVCPNLFGLALLAGRSIPELAPYFQQSGALNSDGPMDWRDIMTAFPVDVVRDAKRRAREAQAHANTTDTVEMLRYWATQRGCVITADTDGHVWIAR